MSEHTCTNESPLSSCAACAEQSIPVFCAQHPREHPYAGHCMSCVRAEAEERRLSDIVVEAAMADSAYRESFQKNKDIDKMLDLSDSLRDACARLAAFRKEKGTRT